MREYIRFWFPYELISDEHEELPDFFDGEIWASEEAFRLLFEA